MNLTDYGWNAHWESIYQRMKDKRLVGRISRVQKNLYWIFTETGEERAILSDTLFMNAFASTELPVVGDWVICERRDDHEKLFIMSILPRRSKFSRKGKDTYGRNYSKAGSSDEQIISANIDTVFLVISLDRDFKLQKIERYLSLICDSGAEAVIILNKADQCSESEEYLRQAQTVAGKTPIYLTSALKKEGIEALLEHVQKGKTITFIGSSGAGKSSLINCLTGQETQYVSYVREGDKRGRHTTTRREMIITDSKAILIDNPGIRDIKLSVESSTLDKTFADIIELSRSCRFRNCRHLNEPGCAVLEAVAEGSISQARLDNYHKLNTEAQNFARRKKARQKFIDRARSEQKRGIKIKKHK